MRGRVWCALAAAEGGQVPARLFCKSQQQQQQDCCPNRRLPATTGTSRGTTFLRGGGEVLSTMSMGSLLRVGLSGRHRSSARLRRAVLPPVLLCCCCPAAAAGAPRRLALKIVAVSTTSRRT